MQILSLSPLDTVCSMISCRGDRRPSRCMSKADTVYVDMRSPTRARHMYTRRMCRSHPSSMDATMSRIYKIDRRVYNLWRAWRSFLRRLCLNLNKSI